MFPWLFGSVAFRDVLCECMFFSPFILSFAFGLFVNLLSRGPSVYYALLFYFSVSSNINVLLNASLRLS